VYATALLHVIEFKSVETRDCLARIIENKEAEAVT
jgi:hypothetical protein